MSNELYHCTPREAARHIKTIMEARLVPFLKGSPGSGKSEIIKQLAAQANLQVIDHRLSTSEPTDLSGLPRFTEDGKYAYFAPFKELFPLEGDEPPPGKKGWLLFLDELNSAPKAVQAAAYKLILDRQVGQHKLNDKVWIVAAGNLDTEKAITNKIGTAMQSRVIHLQLEVNAKNWIMDVAIPRDFDERIRAYISYDESALMKFDPDHDDNTFACPRTWSFVNELIANKPDLKDSDASLLAGTIGSDVAATFIQFTAVYQHMVNMSDVLHDPKRCRIPADKATQWAVVNHLVGQLDKNNFADVAEYISRWETTFQIVFYRYVMMHKPELKSTQTFAQRAIEIMKYLKGDEDYQ